MPMWPFQQPRGLLNNSGYVSEETRQRVEEGKRELGYVPNSPSKQSQMEADF